MEEKDVWVKGQILKVLSQQGQIPSFSDTYRGSYEQSASFYYKQARNLYIANIVLNNQLKTINEEKRFLTERLQTLGRNFQDTSEERKPTRIRKKACQIKRDYHCTYCTKAYGSEGSLSQHVKLKHQDCDSSHITPKAEVDDS